MQCADAVGHSRREGAEQEQEQRDDDAVSMCSNETPVAVDGPVWLVPAARVRQRRRLFGGRWTPECELECLSLFWLFGILPWGILFPESSVASVSNPDMALPKPGLGLDLNRSFPHCSFLRLPRSLPPSLRQEVT